MRDARGNHQGIAGAQHMHRVAHGMLQRAAQHIQHLVAVRVAVVRIAVAGIQGDAAEGQSRQRGQRTVRGPTQRTPRFGDLPAPGLLLRDEGGFHERSMNVSSGGDKLGSDYSCRM